MGTAFQPHKTRIVSQSVDRIHFLSEKHKGNQAKKQKSKAISGQTNPKKIYKIKTKTNLRRKKKNIFVVASGFYFLTGSKAMNILYHNGAIFSVIMPKRRKAANLAFIFLNSCFY